MIRALYTAASGMSAQQLNLDTIANNLANSSTPAFASCVWSFRTWCTRIWDAGRGAEPEHGFGGLQIGLGTKSAATEGHQYPGSLNETDNPLDLASRAPASPGPAADGTIAYTRAGQFQLNNQGPWSPPPATR